MNNVVLQGNVTRDAGVKTFTSGNSVVEFGVAVNRRVKKDDKWVDETDFFDVKSWGKKVPSKGDTVLVSGRLRQETWEVDGSTRSKVVVLADEITLFNGYKKSVATETQPEQQNQDNFGVKAGVDDEVPF